MAVALGLAANIALLFRLGRPALGQGPDLQRRGRPLLSSMSGSHCSLWDRDRDVGCEQKMFVEPTGDMPEAVQVGAFGPLALIRWWACAVGHWVAATCSTGTLRNMIVLMFASQYPP